MALTSRYRTFTIAPGDAKAADRIYPLYLNPKLLTSDTGEDFAASAITTSPLDYDGRDMHHRITVHTHTKSGASNYVAVWASVKDDAGHFVELGRYDNNTNTDAILVTGAIDQAPFKFVCLEIIGDVAGFDIESWGTHVR